MAEEILYGIVEEIIKKLGSLALEERGLCWGVNQEIDKLKNTVSTIRAVLLDAEKKEGQSEQVKDWLGKLKYALYDAEDLLDDFSTEAFQRQAMDGSRLTKEVRLFFSRSNQCAYGLKMGHKIKSLRERLAGINADRSSFQLEERLPDQDEATTRTRSLSSVRETDHVVPEVVIGREGDKKAIISLLLDSDTSRTRVPVISIVGIGGLGKTALAQIVFNDDDIKSHFDLKLWVCVSDDFDTKAVVSKIIESAGERPVGGRRGNLINKLHTIINGKRFLLVLDDVWDSDGERWYGLKKLLRGGGSGSRVLVTTREDKVARIASEAVSTYLLKGLPAEESWSLFAKMAFGDGQEESRRSSLEPIGRDILKKCAGVPLAIKTIGRVLYFKETIEEWLSLKDKELLSVDLESSGTILPILKLSYDHLSSKLKRCFAYCCLYPKDHSIHVPTLIQLWIAQGFVISSHPGECLEEIGLEYFRDLLWRSYFQEVKYDELGNIKSCKMHDLMHDLASTVGGSESKIIDQNSVVVIDENVLHASLGYKLRGEWQIPVQLSRATLLRTLILPIGRSWADMRRWENWESDILSKFKSLRSIDLSCLEIEKLPVFIKRLKHLRYLDFSENRAIKVLPDWITKLQNLQVLKLSGCSSLAQLPKDIRKLKNLGCLDCEGCSALSHMPRGLGQLTSLWRLPVFVVGEGRGSSGASKHKYESGGLEELQGLNNLRGSLEIKNLGNVRNGEREFEAANLKRKNLLQSLHLDWGRRDWAVVDIDYEERCFQRLELHPNLKGLTVDVYGGVRFPSWFSSLTNLVKITISSCRRCQCLPPFHQFPSLQELEIGGLDELEYMVVEENDGEINNAESSSSSSSTLFFPSLKSLSLSYCPKLKGWRKKWGGNNSAATSTSAATVPLTLPHFHRLSALEIRGCPNLTQMPLFPSVTDDLRLVDTSLEPLRQTMEMKRSSTMATSSSSSSSSGTLVMHPPLSDLKELWLWDIGELESLPEEWLQNLISLQQLQITNCPNLKSLPQGMKHHLTSLRRLGIGGCPQLGERCRNNRGADWPIISHIPNIYIGGYIQMDGRYLLGDEDEEAWLSSSD